MDGKQQLDKDKQYVAVVMFLVSLGTALAIIQKNKTLLGVTYTFLFISIIAYYMLS